MQLGKSTSQADVEPHLLDFSNIGTLATTTDVS